MLYIQKNANAKIVKQSVPNVQEVIEGKKQRIVNTVERYLEEDNLEELDAVVDEILKSQQDIKKILGAVLKITFKDELKELGKTKLNLSERSSKLGGCSLVTLVKLVFDDNNSVFALIKLAFAPANEDSD